MRRLAAAIPIVTTLIAPAAALGGLPVPPKAERGKAGATCRPGESGPAARVTLTGLKDRRGRIKLELYPANDADFLAPDRALIAAGKAFRRIEQPVPTGSTATLCIRAPRPGRYALSVLHDRDGDGKFGFLRDGVGFPNNPRLKRAKPKAASVALDIDGVASTTIVMNYRKGLAFGPIGRRS